jgi:hypothetical protein
MVVGLFFLMMGRGVVQGEADVSQLQDCGSGVACGGEGGGVRGDEFLARAGAGAGQDGGH